MSRAISDTKKYLQEVLTKDFGEWTTYRFRKGEGEVVIHRMRVELSRIKNKLRSTGRKVQDFKLVTQWDYNSPDAREFDIVQFAKVRNMLEKEGVNLSPLEEMLIAVEDKGLEDNAED